MVAMLGGFGDNALPVSMRQKGKVRPHTVRWLERELAEARKDLQCAGELLDEKGIALTKALNERDEAMNQRDQTKRLLDENRRWIVEDKIFYERRERELSLSLDRYSNENRILADTNRRNFDKAARSADVAAVLASILAENNSPTEAVAKLVDVCQQMGITPDDDAVKIALKRGYAAQVDRVVNMGGPNERYVDPFRPRVADFFDPDR